MSERGPQPRESSIEKAKAIQQIEQLQQERKSVWIKPEGSDQWTEGEIGNFNLITGMVSVHHIDTRPQFSQDQYGGNNAQTIVDMYTLLAWQKEVPKP